MLFDHHEPLSPGLQAILLLAEYEDLLGLPANEDAGCPVLRVEGAIDPSFPITAF